VKNKTGHDLFVNDCLIHQENPFAKYVKMSNVVTVVAKLGNSIRSKGLNHCQFKQILSDNDSENGDVRYYREVPWLNRGQMPKRVYELKLESNFWI
jgi:hypothetical protein